MENTEIYTDDLTVASDGKTIKKRNARLMAVSLGLMAAGLIAMIALGWVEDHSSALYMLLLTGGIVAVVIGLIYLTFGSKAYVYLPTGSAVGTRTLFFEGIDKDMLWKTVTEGRYDRMETLARAENSGIRLDVRHSADRKFAALQVFTYVPYTYSAAGPVYCLYDGEAEKLLAALGL